MTPLFNLSTALFGSQCSPTSGPAIDMFARAGGTDCVMGDSVAAICSRIEVVGVGVTPSCCFT